MTELKIAISPGDDEQKSTQKCTCESTGLTDRPQQGVSCVGQKMCKMVGTASAICEVHDGMVHVEFQDTARRSRVGMTNHCCGGREVEPIFCTFICWLMSWRSPRESQSPQDSLIFPHQVLTVILILEKGTMASKCHVSMLNPPPPKRSGMCAVLMGLPCAHWHKLLRK